MIRIKPYSFKTIYEIVDEFNIKRQNSIRYRIRTKPFYKSTTDYIVVITDVKNTVSLKLYDRYNKVIEEYNINQNGYLKIKWFYFIDTIEITGEASVKIYAVLKNI